MMHFELDRQLHRDEADGLDVAITAILRDVRLVVRDFEPMQERVRRMIELAGTAAVRYCRRRWARRSTSPSGSRS